MKSMVLALMSLVIVSHFEIDHCHGQKIKWRSLLPFKAREARVQEADPIDADEPDLVENGNAKRRLFSFRPSINLRPRDPSQPGLFSRMNTGTRHFFSSASRNVSDWARDTNRSIHESTQNSWQSLTGGLSRQLKPEESNSVVPRPSIRATDDNSVQPKIRY